MKIGSRLLLLALATGLLSGTDRKQQTQTYAIVGGTVFRESGFALPGAEVAISQTGVPKPKKMKATSDSRGEFAFRVPTVAARYTVSVAAKGYAHQEKSVSVDGEVREDVTFSLAPESKE